MVFRLAVLPETHARTLGDITEAMGVNTPQQLAEVEKTMHSRTGG